MKPNNNNKRIEMKRKEEDFIRIDERKNGGKVRYEG